MELTETAFKAVFGEKWQRALTLSYKLSHQNIFENSEGIEHSEDVNTLEKATVSLYQQGSSSLNKWSSLEKISAVCLVWMSYIVALEYRGDDAFLAYLKKNKLAAQEESPWEKPKVLKPAIYNFFLKSLSDCLGVENPAKKARGKLFFPSLVGGDPSLNGFEHRKDIALVVITTVLTIIDIPKDNIAMNVLPPGVARLNVNRSSSISVALASFCIQNGLSLQSYDIEMIFKLRQKDRKKAIKEVFKTLYGKSIAPFNLTLIEQASVKSVRMFTLISDKKVRKLISHETKIAFNLTKSQFSLLSILKDGQRHKRAELHGPSKTALSQSKGSFDTFLSRFGDDVPVITIHSKDGFLFLDKNILILSP